MPVDSRELLRFGWTLMMTLRYLRTGGGRALTCFNFSQSHWLLPTSAHHHHLLPYLALHTSEGTALFCTQCTVQYCTVACFLSSIWWIEAIALHCIGRWPGGSRGQFHFLSCFCLYLLPQKYYLKPWEILSQMSQTHNIIIVMLIYSDIFDNMLIHWP